MGNTERCAINQSSKVGSGKTQSCLHTASDRKCRERCSPLYAPLTSLSKLLTSHVCSAGRGHIIFAAGIQRRVRARLLTACPSSHLTCAAELAGSRLREQVAESRLREQVAGSRLPRSWRGLVCPGAGGVSARSWSVLVYANS